MTPTTIAIAIIGIVTALLSCVTALITYRREKLKISFEATRTSRLKIVKLNQDSPKPWLATVLKMLIPIMAPFALGFLALSLWLLYIEPSLFTIIAVGFWGLGLWSYAFQFRVLRRGVEGPSYVRREVQVIIDDNYDAIFDRCEIALQGIDAKIISLDRNLGQIHARLGMTWRSFGERVEVTIIQSEGADCTITLVSDSVLPITLLDYGKNSNNLDTLIKYL